MAATTTPELPSTPQSTTKKQKAKASAPDLWASIKYFYAKPGPIIVTLALLTSLGLRIATGQWTWWDLVIPACILAAWPFQEWLIHVFILHFKPRKVGKVTIDPFVANKHRRHHADPWDVDLSFTPLRGVFLVIGLNALLWFSLMPTTALALTGMTSYLLLGLSYEWTHYLIHTRYRPKGNFYKKLWKHHRLHHCKNENYWYGVSMTMGDTVLRTAPNQKEVETSPTCKTVHPQA